jgi:tetratricopeptide (TPR) repeat protein/transcriptional regulator with XRE-family HTH domain
MTQAHVPAQAPSQDGKVVLNAASLKALRKQRGLSQDGLAQLCMEHRLCVSIASIKRAETGKSVLYRTASHLARVYASDLEELIKPPSPAAPTAPLVAEAPEQRTVLGLALLTAAPLPAPLAAQVQQLIGHFGGRQEHPALAVFGLPKAYGSDAVRCLQCAIALAQLLHGQRAALVIANGQWPFGLPEELAQARLVQLLPPVPGTPTVYVAPGLGVQLGERFAFAPTGRAGAWLRLVQECPRLQGPHYPLIGRHVELQQFKATLETTLAYQSGHILYLRGVAGIGKSRLIHEFTEIALHSQFDCHTAVVLDFGVRGDASPLGQLVRSLLGLDLAPGDAALAARMAALQLPAELAMHYRTIMGMSQPSADAALYGALAHHTRDLRQVAAVRELILRKAIARPLLLVLEDIHWSSPELIATLAALLPEVQEAPLVWVLSSRFEHDPLDHALRPYLNGLPVTMLDLATLRAPEALAMARHASDPDPDFHAQCVARAQGNPLFLTQLLLSGRSPALPSSLNNLVQAKLDQLPAPQRQGLRVASAIGQYFSLALLRDALGQPEHELTVSVRQCMVRPAEHDNYVFVHDLVMQGIYESMPAAQRDQIHATLARCYGRGEPRLRAEHLHKGRHADAPQAMLEAIAERIAAYQYAQALELVGQCRRIDYAARDDFELHFLSGQCHAKMGQTQSARLCFSDALELARDQRQRVAAVIGLATALNVLEDLVAEEALLDAAIDAAQAGGIDEGLAELYYLKGNIYFPAGNFAMSRQLHEQAQRYARSKDTEARALSGIGDSYYAQGRIVTAHQVFHACLALCELHGLPDIEASNRFMLGTARLYLNQTDAALADALASAEVGRRVGNRRAEIVSRLTASWAFFSMGQVGAARGQVEQGLELARQIGAARFEPFLNESLVRVLLLEGKPGAAHALALQAWQMVQASKLQKFIGPWVLATLALTEPDATARAGALAQGQALLDQGCVGHKHYRYYVGAMETCLIHAQLDDALALAARFSAYIHAEPFPWATHHIDLVRCCASSLAQPSPARQAALLRILAAGQAAGLGWVMPLLRQRLGQTLRLE